MADLFTLLNTGAWSLSAHRAATATASHNLANATTEGYSRQRAELVATTPARRLGGAYVGRGVSLSTVSQARDRFLEQQIPGALAARAEAGAEADALAAVSVFDPEGGGGLADALSSFYGALSDLTNRPGEPALREVVVERANGLARAFNRTAQALDEARDGLDVKLAGEVEEINHLAEEVARLNAAIRSARASGAEPNDLLDQRTLARDRLAELTGARPIPDGEGNLSLALADGTALVSGDLAARLSTVPDPANGGHLALAISRPDGSGPVSVDQAALGGSLGGLLSARDGALASAETAVDQLAFDLAGEINTVHQAGFGLDGVSGRVLFEPPAGVGGAAAALRVEAAIAQDATLLATSDSAAGVPGNGGNLLRLLATQDAPLSTGQSAAAALGDAVAAFGSAAAGVDAAFRQSSAIEERLTTMRESVSGVSIDEEMIEMTKAQRTFEAVMRVVETADEMLATLMRLR
ncbi:MAG: flagellar hook-associated protein FlgK [Deltaproteobacteria bacterium]|nr:MAG: flagellar hook-associated protein FlgK [Deltaproteobacteria bacterium]